MTDSSPYAPPDARFPHEAGGKASGPCAIVIRFFTPLLLGLIGMYCTWNGFVGAWWWFVVAAVSQLVALGQVAGHVWAKYAWYAMAGVAIIGWFCLLGYTLWLLRDQLASFNGNLDFVMDVLPTLLFLAVCGVGVVTTRKNYSSVHTY